MGLGFAMGEQIKVGVGVGVGGCRKLNIHPGKAGLGRKGTIRSGYVMISESWSDVVGWRWRPESVFSRREEGGVWRWKRRWRRRSRRTEGRPLTSSIPPVRMYL